MIEFLEKKKLNNKKRKVGTPTKKVKLNEDSEGASDFEIPFIDLVFIKNISKTDNPNSNLIPNERRKSSFKIADFTMTHNIELMNSNNENDPFLINKDSDSDMDE